MVDINMNINQIHEVMLSIGDKVTHSIANGNWL